MYRCRTLGETYGHGRLEAACRRALVINGLSYRSVESILKSGLDSEPVTPPQEAPPIQHDNVRGPSYYSGREEATPC
jgi:hypothetical protein